LENLSKKPLQPRCSRRGVYAGSGRAATVQA